MEIMTVLMLVFIVLLCLPVIYLAFFFIRQLNRQLARNLRQKKLMRDIRNEKRTVHNNRRPGWGR